MMQIVTVAPAQSHPGKVKADRRMGELDAEVVVDRKGGRGKTVSRGNGLPAERVEALRNRAVASLPAADFDAYTRAARIAEQPVTVAPSAQGERGDLETTSPPREGKSHASAERLRAIAEQPVSHNERATETRGATTENQPEHNKYDYGTSAGYLAARIARDAPEVHEAMKRGEFKSTLSDRDAMAAYLTLRDANPRDERAITRARNVVAGEHTGLAWSIARKYSRGVKHLEADDLAQAGMLGVLRALDTYDPARGKFSTYATPWVKHMVRRELGVDREIRLPPNVAEKVAKVGRIEHARGLHGQPLPEKAELARQLEIGREALERVLAARRTSVTSLDATVDVAENTLHDVLAGVPGEHLDDALDRLEHDRRVREVVEMLPAREREIIIRRAEGATLREIAGALGVCSERVRQVERDALQVVRAELRRRGIGA